MPPRPVPPELIDWHHRHNRSTDDRWGSFAVHRARVTALVEEAGRGRLCVLGAGNCNDLDLAALVGRFEEIHLVDLDRAALDRAWDRQTPALRARLTLHAPVDASGALADLPLWRTAPPPPETLARLPALVAERLAAAVPSTFDVVLSAALLSQLMWTCNEALGDGHPLKERVAVALVVGHLAGVARLVRPGGAGLIVTDTVTSRWFPVADLFDPQDPMAVVDRAVEARRAIPGTAPGFIELVLGEDEALTPLVESPEVTPPWLWQLDEEQLLVTYAARFRRRAPG
jgi:hypothetical protein